jgi:hypothetical protein
MHITVAAIILVLNYHQHWTVSEIKDDFIFDHEFKDVLSWRRCRIHKKKFYFMLNIIPKKVALVVCQFLESCIMVMGRGRGCFVLAAHIENYLYNSLLYYIILFTGLYCSNENSVIGESERSMFYLDGSLGETTKALRLAGFLDLELYTANIFENTANSLKVFYMP